MKNYRAINDNVAAIVTRAATVEEVCFEVNSSFYFREKIIAKSYVTISEMAVSVWEQVLII